MNMFSKFILHNMTHRRPLIQISEISKQDSHSFYLCSSQAPGYLNTFIYELIKLLYSSYEFMLCESAEMEEFTIGVKSCDLQ